MEDFYRKCFKDKKEGKIENCNGNVNKEIYFNNSDEMKKNKDNSIDFSLYNNSNHIQIKISLNKEFFSEQEKNYNQICNNQDKDKIDKTNDKINEENGKINKNKLYIKDFIHVNKINCEILKIKERLIQFIIKKEYQNHLYK